MANYTKLMIEMFVVGCSLVLMALALEYAQGRKIASNTPGVREMVTGLFVAGALLHVVFEGLGVNEWYVRQYTPLLK